MVGVYEPYVEVCRRLAELSPCAGERAEVDPRQLGRRGGGERRQDRALGHGPAGGRRLRQRLSRPHPVDDDDDGEGEAVQGRLRAVRARGLPRAGAESLSRRHDRRRDRGTASSSSRPTSIPLRSRAPCSSRCRVRAASSPCPRTILRRLQELCREHGILYVDDEVQSGVGRTGKMWAIEHYDGVSSRPARRRASRSAAACRSRP